MNKEVTISKFRKIISRYPDALYAYIGGSLNTPFASRYSDIDLFIIWPSIPTVKDRGLFLEQVALIFNQRSQWFYLDFSGEILRDAAKLENLPKVEVYHYSMEGYAHALECMSQQEGMSYSLSQRTEVLSNESLELFIDSYLEQEQYDAPDLYFKIMKDKQQQSGDKTTLENIYRLVSLTRYKRVPSAKHWPKIKNEIPLNLLLSEESVLKWIARASDYLATLAGIRPALEMKDTDFRIAKYDKAYEQLIFQTVVSQRRRLEEFLSWPSNIRTLKDQIEFGKLAEEQWVQGRAFHFQLFHNSVFVGAISIHSMNYSERSFEFGYWIDAQSEGRGLIYRGLTMLIKDMSSKGWDMAKIRVSLLNTRSCKAAERLGMKLRSKSGSQLTYSMDLTSPSSLCSFSK